jgi:hypothetical protein
MSRGRGVHIVTEKYEYKKGLFCSVCNKEIYKRTLNGSGIKHSYNAFTDSCKFEVVCSKCIDAQTVMPLAVMFPANLQQQISRLTHYLAQDSVNLLAFFRCLEGICYALELKRDLSIPDPHYDAFMSDKSTADTKRLYYDDDVW